MYSAIHEVDRLRWLVGSDVVTVAGQTRRWDPDSEVEDGAVKHRYYVSDDPEKFVSLGRRFIEKDIINIEKVEL